MSTKASTHRLEPETQAALTQLAKVLRQPKNRLINEAIKLYVEQRSRTVERELEATLRALRAYRQKDQDFEKAIETFVQAEAQWGGEDPVEGRILAGENSVQSEIQHLLRA